MTDMENFKKITQAMFSKSKFYPEAQKFWLINNMRYFYTLYLYPGEIYPLNQGVNFLLVQVQSLKSFNINSYRGLITIYIKTRWGTPHWYQTLNQLVPPHWKKKNYTWHVTHDMWHLTRDTWHVTRGGGVKILSKF